MIRYIGIGVGALLWGLVVFALALRIHFPDEALIERAQWEVQSASKGEWLLKVEDASPWRMTGVTLENATLYKAAKPTPRRRRNAENAEAAAPPAPEPVLTTSALSVRVSPFALLRGQRAAHFAADLYDGSLEGDVSLDAAETSFVALAEDLDLSLVPLSGKSWSMDAAGRMNLDVDMTINKEEIKESAGHVKLAIDGFTINSGELMGFTLDKPTVFTEAVIEMIAENGKLEIQKGSFVSDAVTVTVGGSITLAPTLRRTRLQLKLTFDLPDEYDALAKNLPQLKNARDDEGIYHFLVSGTFSSPSFREDRIGVRRQRGAPPESSRSRIDAQIREEEQTLTDEEREARRAERLQRMQERMQRGGSAVPGEGPDMPQRPGLRPPNAGGSAAGRRGRGLENAEDPGAIPYEGEDVPEPELNLPGDPEEYDPNEPVPLDEGGEFIEEEQ